MATAGRERNGGFEANVREKRTFAGGAGKGARTLCSYKLAITCWVHSLEITECLRLVQGNILANARLTECDTTHPVNAPLNEHWVRMRILGLHGRSGRLKLRKLHVQQTNLPSSAYFKAQ